jgi:DNA helicase II / ATP-dependent DNA helicase PcrA
MISTAESTDFALPLSVPSPIQLDEHQRRVVEWRVGEALVAAGAGSGKTTVLIERCAAIIGEGCAPESVLTLVYNKSAASTLKRRLRERLGPELGDRVKAFTFHGWCYGVLRELLQDQIGRGVIVGTDGGPSAFTIGKQLLAETGIQGWDLKDLLRASELAREALVDVDAGDAVQAVMALPLDLQEWRAADVVRFTREYQRAKAQLEAIDFADMLALVCRLIQGGGSRAELLAERYTHVQVDEHQDGNVARNLIATHLAQGALSLVMVGDARQSIYGFTGARPDLFRSRLGAGAELLTLPINRRSTAPIVALGNRIAEGRDWNLGGPCFPSPAALMPAEEVRVMWTESEPEEADAVVREVQARIEAGVPLATDGRANYAALVRTNGAGAQLECAFLARGLPCRVLGQSGGVWSSSAGKDVLAYLRAAAGKADKDLVRISNKPRRYLKRAVVERALETGGDIVDALYKTRDRNALQLGRDVDLLRDLAWEKRVKYVVRLLVDDLRDRGDDAVGEPDEDKAELYTSLGAAAVTLGSLEAIDAQIAALKKVKDKDPAVEISTIHKAKGLEWHTVFTCSAADAVLPHKKARDVEEERRLFYVAVTRAKRVALISTGAPRPSPFLAEVGFVKPKTEEA